MHCEDQMSDKQTEGLFKSVVAAASFEKLGGFLIFVPVALLAIYFKTA